MNHEDELHLARRAIRGDPDAYGELIRHYQEYLYKMAWLQMNHEDNALDLVSATILKGWQGIRKLKHPEWFKTWITRILLNTAKTELKKIAYYEKAESVTPELPVQNSSVEERIDLEQAICRLPDRHRLAIQLKYFSGLSVKEIAFVMNAPEGSVKAYLSRGRYELKKILKEGYFHAY